MEFPIGTRVEMKRVVATYGSQVRVSANDIHGVSLRKLSICGHAHIPLPDLPRACAEKRAGSRDYIASTDAMIS